MDSKLYELIGVAMEVHNTLGPGFVEKVYGDAFKRELLLRNIPFEREKELTVFYKGERIESTFYEDFVCYGSVIVELKAVSNLLPIHKAQLLNYMKATGIKKGLLINFATQLLEFEKYVYH